MYVLEKPTEYPKLFSEQVGMTQAVRNFIQSARSINADHREIHPKGHVFLIC